jgi:hypothetical protein
VTPGPTPVRRRLRNAAPILTCVGLFARASEADTKTPAYVEMGTCAAAPSDEVMSLVRVELGTQLVDAPSETSCRVVVECWGDVVTVSVSAPERLARSHRTDLTGSPFTVRPRIVALEIAELVRDVAREPEVLRTAPADQHRPPTIAPTPWGPERPTETPVRRESSAQTGLGAFALASTFRYDGRWLLGGGLRFDYSRDWLCAGLDATLATREEASELGSAQVLLTRLSPYVAWRLAARGLVGRLGAGYAVGMARVAGRADDARGAGDTLSGPWAGPYALAGVAYAATDALSLDLRAEMGWVMLPVVGQVARGNDIAIQGAWTSVLVGMSFAL